MYRILVGSTILLLIGLGSATFIRNMAWRTEKSLWEDVLQKAPNNPRAYHNIAAEYYEPIGDYDKAIAYFKKAAKFQYPIKSDLSQPYYCIGDLYDKKNEIKEAIAYYKKSISVWYGYVKPHYKIAIDYIKQGQYAAAEKHIDSLLGVFPDKPSYLFLKGILLLDQHRFDSALLYFRKCLMLQPDDSTNYLYIDIE